MPILFFLLYLRNACDRCQQGHEPCQRCRRYDQLPVNRRYHRSPPIVAIAVCAIVLIARIPAAFNHFFVHTLGFNTQFFSISASSHLSFFLSYCTTATNVPLGAAPSYIHCMLDSCDGFLPAGENQGYMYAVGEIFSSKSRIDKGVFCTIYLSGKPRNGC